MKKKNQRKQEQLNEIKPMLNLAGVEKLAPSQNLTANFHISKRWIIMTH